jgi:hypothetical protein
MPADTAEALVAELEARGVRLEPRGDRLRYESPPGAMTAEHKAALAAHRPAVLALLRQRRASDPWGAEGVPLGAHIMELVDQAGRPLPDDLVRALDAAWASRDVDRLRCVAGLVEAWATGADSYQVIHRLFHGPGWAVVRCRALGDTRVVWARDETVGVPAELGDLPRYHLAELEHIRPDNLQAIHLVKTIFPAAATVDDKEAM